MSTTVSQRRWKHQALFGQDVRLPIELLTNEQSLTGSAGGGTAGIIFELRLATEGKSSEVYGLASLTARFTGSAVDSGTMGALFQGFELNNVARTLEGGLAFAELIDGAKSILARDVVGMRGTILGMPTSDTVDCKITLQVDNIENAVLTVQIALFRWDPRCWAFGGPIVPSGIF